MTPIMFVNEAQGHDESMAPSNGDRVRSRHRRGLRHRASKPALDRLRAAPVPSNSSLAVLDIGCGAGRNAVPLALSGANVIGTDLSLPMLQAARDRTGCSRLQLALAPMDALPVRDRSIDLIIAHGIWNLARSGAEFRRAVAEAARAALPGAALFVFTFSRTRWRVMPGRSPERRSCSRSSPVSHRCS